MPRYLQQKGATRREPTKRTSSHSINVEIPYIRSVLKFKNSTKSYKCLMNHQYSTNQNYTMRSYYGHDFQYYQLNE